MIISLDARHWDRIRDIYLEGLATGEASFETAALTMGELCHFLGRDFVCGIFTWPAGEHRSTLFGYNVDRESAEYAVKYPRDPLLMLVFGFAGAIESGLLSEPRMLLTVR